MSRSQRHRPKTGITTACGEKQDRRRAAGRRRCLARTSLTGSAEVLTGSRRAKDRRARAPLQRPASGRVWKRCLLIACGFGCNACFTTPMHNIQTDQRPDGRRPYADWLAGLVDRQARARVTVRVHRMAAGNFGDCKPLGGGVWELRID